MSPYECKHRLSYCTAKAERLSRGEGGDSGAGIGGLKLHVLLLSTIFPSPALPAIVGGAEVVARRYAEALVARGVRVSVIRGLAPGQTIPIEQVGGIDIHSLPIRRPYWPFDEVERSRAAKLRWHAAEDLGEAKQIGVLIEEIAPDLVHSHNISGLSSGVWRAAARARLPIVHTLHDYYLVCPRATRFRNGGRCRSTCNDCCFLTFRRRQDSRLIGDVVGVSGAMLNEQVDCGLFVSARRHVVPNIVEPTLVPAALDQDGSVVFGFLGRVTEEKGIFQLADALKRMQGNARLVVGGRVDEDMRIALQARAGNATIEFLGFVLPQDFFRQIDVLVVPSIWSDPFPTVILEAQRAGRPTLGSLRGGIPEAIGSIEAGWTYDPDDEHALSNLLDKINAEPHQIAAKGKAATEAAKRFNADTVVERYLAIYNRALRK